MQQSNDGLKESNSALTGLIDRIENISSRSLVVEQEKNAMLMEQIKQSDAGTTLLAQADELAQLREMQTQALIWKQELAKAHTQIEELKRESVFAKKNLDGAQMELQLKSTGLESTDEPTKSAHQIEMNLVKRSNEILGNDYTAAVLKIQALEEQIKNSEQQKEQDAAKLQEISARYTAEAASRSVAEEELKSWKDWILDDEKTGMNQQAITQLQQELAKLRTEHSSALNTVSTAQAEIETLKQQLAQALSEKQQTLSEFELQVVLLKKQVTDKEAKIIALSKEAASNLADLNKTKSQISTEEQTHTQQMLKATKHQATLQALHAAQQHAVQLQASSACEKANKLQQDLELAQQRIRELEAKEIEPNDGEQSLNSSQDGQVTEACHLLQQYKALIESQDKQVTEAQSQSAQLSDELKSKTLAFHSEIQSLQQRCNEMQDELNRHGNLQSQLEEAQTLLLKKEKVASDALHRQELLKIKLRQTEDSLSGAQQRLVINSRLRSMSSGGGTMPQIDQNLQTSPEFVNPAVISQQATDSMNVVAKEDSDLVCQDQSVSIPDVDSEQQADPLKSTNATQLVDLKAGDELADRTQTLPASEEAINSEVPLQVADGNCDEELHGIETGEESDNYVANGDLVEESIVADPMDLCDDVQIQEENMGQAENVNDGENTAIEEPDLQQDQLQSHNMQNDMYDEPSVSEIDRYELSQAQMHLDDEMDQETNEPAPQDSTNPEKDGQDEVANTSGLPQDSTQHSSADLLAAAPEQLEPVMDREPEVESEIDIAKDVDEVHTVTMEDGDEGEQSMLEEQPDHDLVIEEELAEEQDHAADAASEVCAVENEEDGQDDFISASDDNGASPNEALTEEDGDDSVAEGANVDADDDNVDVDDADNAVEEHDDDHGQ